MPFLLIFVIIPLIEIGLFIAIGGEIGLLTTFLLCFLSAVLGIFLMRLAGVHALMAAQGALRQARMPLREVFDGMCILLAGGLFLFPGFFTDFLGFALLIPAVRSRLRDIMKGHWLPAEYEEFYTAETADPSDEYGVYTVIEGEYERISPQTRPEDA